MKGNSLIVKKVVLDEPAVTEHDIFNLKVIQVFDRNDFDGKKT